MAENTKALHDIMQDLLQEVSVGDVQYIAVVHSSEDVQVGGELDATISCIRRGLELYDYAPESKAQKRDHRDAFEETKLYGVTVNQDQVYYSQETKRPISRTHNRILLSTYGWPIKYFLDLLELLQILKDSIQGNVISIRLCYYAC